jgi:hypothetical protein
MIDTDAEDLIASLAGEFAPAADRGAFRRAAEATLALSPQSCLGPGSIYRTLVPVWRKFFHPPTADERGPQEQENATDEANGDGH